MGNSLYSSTMKFLVAFTYFFVFAMAQGLKDQAEDQHPRSCPYADSNYLGKDITDVHGVEDWHACGGLCQITTGCEHWSLLTGSEDNLCILHLDGAILEKKDGALSGDKGCM